MYVIFPNIEKPERETDKAIKLFGAWMPKSQVKFTNKYVIIPLWLFVQKNLSYWDNTGSRIAQKVSKDDLCKWLS
jgi:hypothetical protein